MLVCNVSLRPRRGAIAADIAEVALALDASTIGQIVFATLVDDPASVGEIIDAYLGEIMLEAATADAVADGGLVYIAAIDEAVTAIAAADGAVPTIYTDAVAETASASDTLDASAAAGAAKTTMRMVGSLSQFDTTFPSSLTVINVGR